MVAIKSINNFAVGERLQIVLNYKSGNKYHEPLNQA